MEVRPFTIHVPDDVLEDLRWRLGHTRFPDEIPGSGWDYGSNLDYLKALVHYWRTDFDWRAQEEQLNRFHHYKTLVDGLNISDSRKTCMLLKIGGLSIPAFVNITPIKSTAYAF